MHNAKDLTIRQFGKAEDNLATTVPSSCASLLTTAFDWLLRTMQIARAYNAWRAKVPPLSEHVPVEVTAGQTLNR